MNKKQMNIINRIEVVENKVGRLTLDVKTKLYYPSFHGQLKKLILEANKNGEETVSIEDIVTKMESLAD